MTDHTADALIWLLYICGFFGFCIAFELALSAFEKLSTIFNKGAK